MKKIEVLILIALPASGKSEVMKFLHSRTTAELDKLHLDSPAHVDDYPYVEFMRTVDEAAVNMLKMEPIFFKAADRGFKDPYEWITLIELLNLDAKFAQEKDGASNFQFTESDAARELFTRIDQSELRAGARLKLHRLPCDVRHLLMTHTAKKAKALMEKKIETMLLNAVNPRLTKTAVVEFSRGGPIGAEFPFDPPFGYQYALRRLDPQILESAAVLYINVSPAESRRRNAERAVPPPGCTDTTLFHGVPTEVMLRDYGADDFADYLASSLIPNEIVVKAHGKEFFVPAAIFDNEADLTSFIRGERDPKKWNKVKTKALFTGLIEVMNTLNDHP